MELKNACITERILVTPQKAAEMLKHNELNRPVRKNKVEVYARIMERGAWGESDSAICFDREGHLLNGQHRLFAIVKSGVSVMLDVKRNLSREDFANLDNPTLRKAGDSARALYPGDPVYAGSTAYTFLNAFVNSKVLGNPSAQTHHARTKAELIDLVTQYHGLAKLAVHINNRKHTRNARLRNAAFLTATVSAVCCGAALSDICDFIDTCCNILPDGKPYNCKAALDYERTIILSPISEGRFAERELEAEQAIYCFLNNQKQVKRDAVYRPSVVDIETANALWEVRL